MKVENKRIFIFRWLISIFVGLAVAAMAAIAFCESRIGEGVFLSLCGAFILIRDVFFVPHSFIFDRERITLIYVFRSQSVKYVNIKSCDKEFSGVKSYPWGDYYSIITDKLFWQEVKIPSTPEIDLQINKRINNKIRTKKKK